MTPFPTRARTAATSFAEQTIPLTPQETARPASRATASAAPRENPTSARSASSRLVRTVTARSVVPVPRALSAAAVSIARPPEAWTVANFTPRAAAERTAPATVLGMSWNFRSRKTSNPASRTRRTSSGPPRGNSSIPTLNIPTSPERASTVARAVPGESVSRATMIRSFMGRTPPSSSRPARTPRPPPPAAGSAASPPSSGRGSRRTRPPRSFPRG